MFCIFTCDNKLAQDIGKPGIISDNQEMIFFINVCCALTERIQHFFQSSCNHRHQHGKDNYTGHTGEDSGEFNPEWFVQEVSHVAGICYFHKK